MDDETNVSFWKRIFVWKAQTVNVYVQCEHCHCPCGSHKPPVNKGVIMANFVLKNDNPDFQVVYDIGDVTDAEGEILDDSAVNLVVESSDPAALEVTPMSDGTPNGYNCHVGSSGIAQLSAVVPNPNNPDEPFASHGDSFTITKGDPNAVSGITANFTGVTPVPEPEPEPTPEPEPEPTPTPEG